LKSTQKAQFLPCIIGGVLTGIVTGAVVFLFKLCAKYAEQISRSVYTAAKTSPQILLVVIAVLLLFTLGMFSLHRAVPEVRGGGIPRSEGILRGVLSFRPLKTLLGTFGGSMMSYLAGLPLGSEGPAVLIGTSLGSLCGKAAKQNGSWDRYVMTGGAGAGFAVATGAPLSGILFALEEIHKRFTPLLVMTVSLAVVFATWVNKALCAIFGLDAALFHFPVFANFELSHAGYLLALGILIALAVGVFDSSLQWLEQLQKRAKIPSLPNSAKLAVAFGLTGILGFFLTDGIYSGHDVIHNLAEEHMGVWMMILLLAVRMGMMMIMTHAGTTGGTFIPTLAIGALTGALLVKLLVVLGLPQELYVSAMLLGMCVFIGSSLRSPITGAILYLELTGQFTDLFFVALVAFVANAVTEMLGRTSFYDHVLEQLAEKEHEGKEAQILCFRTKVADHAFVAGKSIRDIMWPATAVVLSVMRPGDMRPDTDIDSGRKLSAGDTLLIRVRVYDEDAMRKTLADLVGGDHPIETVPL